MLFLLVDTETAHWHWLKRLDSLEEDHEIVLFGTSMTAGIPVEVLSSLFAHASKMRFIDCGIAGRNSAYLHLMAELGRMSAEHKGSRFVVLSNSTIYDDALGYLHNQGVEVTRQEAKPDHGVLKAVWSERGRFAGFDAELEQEHIPLKVIGR